MLLTVSLGQLLTVPVDIIAGVGGSGGQAGAQATALLAVSCCGALVTIPLSKVGAVTPLVNTWCLGSEGSIRRASSRSTGYSHHVFSNATHANSPLQSDESFFSPISSPGVLDQPEVLSSLTSIAYNSDSMISVRSLGTSSKDSSSIGLEWSGSFDRCNNCTVLVYQLLQSLFIPLVSVVKVSNLSSLVVSC